MKIKQPKIVKLRWGVAGGSKITENKFLPAMKVLKRSSLAAIYSSSPERAKFLASESASKIKAPFFLKNSDAVDFPEPIPPVIPNLYTAQNYY